MAKENKGRHYEMVLEDRQLLVVFFAVVLLCAIFFTLGFVLGRSQAASQKAASTPAEKGPAAPPAAAPAPDLSFYQHVEGKQPPESLPSATPESKLAEAKPAAATPSPTASQSPRGVNSPPAPAAAPIYLQVAAVTQEPDAKRLAEELQKLGFPAVIRPPSGDHLYRVQVGPFQNAELAAAAQRRLEAQGFRGIVKR